MLAARSCPVPCGHASVARTRRARERPGDGLSRRCRRPEGRRHTLTRPSADRAKTAPLAEKLEPRRQRRWSGRRLIEIRNGETGARAPSPKAEMETRLSKLRALTAEDSGSQPRPLHLLSQCQLLQRLPLLRLRPPLWPGGRRQRSDHASAANIDGGQPWRRSFGDNLVYTDWQRDNFFRALQQLAPGQRHRIGIEFDHLSLERLASCKAALPDAPASSTSAKPTPCAAHGEVGRGDRPDPRGRASPTSAAPPASRPSPSASAEHEVAPAFHRRHGARDRRDASPMPS